MTRAWLVGLATLAAAPAEAQDALRGKRLYLDAATLVGSGVSCVDCHGGLPRGAFGIDSAAGDPAAVERAIASITEMTPFRGRLAAADFVDLAAYIADPAVASPAARVTTWLPSGAAGADDRIAFGELDVDDAPAVAALGLTSTGQQALTITADAEVAGPDADQFSIGANDCRAGTVLAPGRSCRIELRFAPVGTAGPRFARVRVAHDWVSSPAAVALLGSVRPTAAAPPDEPPRSADAVSGCRSSRRSTRNAVWPLLAFLALRSWMRRARRGLDPPPNEPR